MVTVLAPGDSRYPRLLGQVGTMPTLWVRGSIEDEDALAVAIVGSRRATTYGTAVAERLASELAARGVTIVSGFARGIDTAAHRGALGAGGRTVAVLGSGIDVIYPLENRALANAVERHGALVSQYAPGTPALPRNFPARNRTIAALALGVVVVEAAERSGALITAGVAGALGREVFAVPGRITSDTSRGANRLIQDGAKLIQDWTDVVSELPEEWRRLVRGAAVDPGSAERPAEHSDDGRVLALLGPDEPRHIETLIERSGLPAARVGATLSALELRGLARQLMGQRWIAVLPRARRRGASSGATTSSRRT
jgi:DNA processing protein